MNTTQDENAKSGGQDVDLRHFSPGELERIRSLRQQGMSVRKLATTFGKSQWMVVKLLGSPEAGESAGARTRSDEITSGFHQGTWPEVRGQSDRYVGTAVSSPRLSLPDMVTAGARHGFGRFLLDQLLFADGARFNHHVRHSLYSLG